MFFKPQSRHRLFRRARKRDRGGLGTHREGAGRMIPLKLEACRKENEMLMEYDLIEPSKSPWACGVVIVKKRRTI